MRLISITIVVAAAILTTASKFSGTARLDQVSPPEHIVKLIFIHHSTGENWLDDGNGQLGLALRDNNYFVSDTNYGWGPADEDKGYDTIGDHTDIPDWYSWFTGPHRATYLAALYAESAQHSSYARLVTDPGGENTIVMFKSCFPNSNLDGNPNDPPAAAADMNSPYDVAHAKRIYLDALNYFAAHQDKLFVVITAPPLAAGDTDAARAANARAFNNWLVNSWRSAYAYPNVAVFDFYNVLTSNGGDPDTNDLDWETGNHHRYRNNTIEHITGQLNGLGRSIAQLLTQGQGELSDQCQNVFPTLRVALTGHRCRPARDVNGPNRDPVPLPPLADDPRNNNVDSLARCDEPR